MQKISAIFLHRLYGVLYICNLPGPDELHVHVYFTVMCGVVVDNEDNLSFITDPASCLIFSVSS